MNSVKNKLLRSLSPVSYRKLNILQLFVAKRTAVPQSAVGRCYSIIT